MAGGVGVIGLFSAEEPGLSSWPPVYWGESAAEAEVLLLVVSGSVDGGPAGDDHACGVVPAALFHPTDSAWRVGMQPTGLRQPTGFRSQAGRTIWLSSRSEGLDCL